MEIDLLHPTIKNEAENAESAAKIGDAKSVLEWQHSLRRFMVGIILFAFVLFIGSVLSIALVWQQARESQNFDMDFSNSLTTPPVVSPDGRTVAKFSPTDKIEYTQWATRSLLEKNLIERRYNQAKLTLMTRTWISYIGFITGMLLALMGATFVLGKLSDGGTTAGVEGGGMKGNLVSTSPGIVLAILGTVLMGINIYTDHRINVDDVSTYLPTDAVLVKKSEVEATPPTFTPNNTEISPKDAERAKQLKERGD
jgi:hypothetical protein